MKEEVSSVIVRREGETISLEVKVVNGTLNLGKFQFAKVVGRCNKKYSLNIAIGNTKSGNEVVSFDINRGGMKTLIASLKERLKFIEVEENAKKYKRKSTYPIFCDEGHHLSVH